MSPSELADFLQFAIKNKFPVLIKGKPAVGKTSIMKQACKLAGADLYISHPVVSDPTDYKGLPFPDKDGKSAHFLPYGDLNILIHATKPTVFFLDDLGQASAMVQASAMQLILGRRINGHKVSDHVVFMSATNRREDKAGVNGILEPVKSRFASIVELTVDTEDWITWAKSSKMPYELVAFAKWRPSLLDDFKPSKDLTNSPSPRTYEAIGNMMNAGIPKNLEFEVFKGAVGEGCATELLSFLTLVRDLPSLDDILANPDSMAVPIEAHLQYAIMTGLAYKADKTNFANSFKYMERMPAEMRFAFMKEISSTKNELTNSKVWTNWATTEGAKTLTDV